MNPLVLAHNRHSILIECLQRHAQPVAQSERFAVYELNAPADQSIESEIVIVHNFSLAEIDNNIGYYVANDLLPLLQSTRQTDFEHLVGAVVRSSDIDEQRAWQRFYSNSLASLEQAIRQPEAVPDFIWPFGSIYDQIIRLVQGQSLLDVGTCFGFFPLLFANREYTDRNTGCQRIVGCDLDAALIRLADSYARYRRFSEVSFVVADILSDNIRRLQTFDTVVCIHTLEHLNFEQTGLALAHLWQLTARRLIVSVPLEETPDPRFGHRQVFDRARLEAIGEQFGEGSQYRYFEHHGGWLVVDR